ncbi:MAG: hypothetical protein JJT90_16980 [Ectothiorhodospiraceae bacterium]|nr:hypothetical protein [Ectothiorhodospiraceae bacterium]
MQAHTHSRAAREQTLFVTGLAWLFIVTGVATTVVLLAVAVVPQWSLAMAQAAAALEPGRGTGGLTAGAHWLAEQRAWLMAGLLLGAVVTTVAAVALLQRRRWARRLFVGLMVCGFCGTFVAMAMSSTVFSLVPDGATPTVDADNPLGGLIGLLALGIVGATALAGLFGWVGWKLTSPEIRAEFGG